MRTLAEGAEEAGGHKHFAPAETIQNVQQICQACAWQYQPWSVTVRQVSWSGLLVPCTQTQMLNCQIAQKLLWPQRQDLVQKGELRKAACRQIHSNTDGKKAIYDAGQRLVISGKRDGNNTSCLRKRENEDLPTHCKTEYQSMNPSKGDQASEMSIERKSNKLLLFATCIVILVHYLAFSPWQLSWDSEITSLQTSPSREITSSETLYVKELIGPALVLSISSQCMVTNGCQPPHRYNQ